MATDFEVDLQALQTLARDLGQAMHSMGAARGELSAASHGGTGDSALDGACGEFQSKWGYGLGQLEKTAAAFVSGLDETVKAYQAVEEQVAKSFGGGTGGHGVLQPVGHVDQIPTPILRTRPIPGTSGTSGTVDQIPTPILRTRPVPGTAGIAGALNGGGSK